MRLRRGRRGVAAEAEGDARHGARRDLEAEDGGAERHAARGVGAAAARSLWFGRVEAEREVREEGEVGAVGSREWQRRLDPIASFRVASRARRSN